MKRFTILALSLIFAGGCNDSADEKEQQGVQVQQAVYNKKQPTPFFEWSLDRQRWIEFYRARNEAVSTWSYITPQNSTQVMFETPSQGYPVPFDTQLTNPTQRAGGANYSVTIDQAEPNGLFTSKNSDGTIIMATNDDGTVSPVYTELKVTCFPFPVRMENGKWVRVEGSKPTITLSKGKKQ